MTWGDRIRAMTDEELAIMIDGHYFLLGCPATIVPAEGGVEE